MSKHLMVAEANPLWLRFWALYPKRQAKKEARKAWWEIAPSAGIGRWAKKQDWFDARMAATGDQS